MMNILGVPLKSSSTFRINWYVKFQNISMYILGVPQKCSSTFSNLHLQNLLIEDIMGNKEFEDRNPALFYITSSRAMTKCPQPFTLRA
jgi:hypothetical protein